MAINHLKQTLFDASFSAMKFGPREHRRDDSTLQHCPSSITGKYVQSGSALPFCSIRSMERLLATRVAPSTSLMVFPS
jgi:hypothetical protein